MKKFFALAATIALATAAIAQNTEYVKIIVTENPNLAVQQDASTVIGFSANGLDNVDNSDMSSLMDHNSPGDFALPFTLTPNNDVITYFDARPDLSSYKTIPLGFTTKDSATIKVFFTNSSDDVNDSTYRPGYLWLEHVPTGEMWEVLEDTVKIHIEANQDFTADYRIHIGPKVAKVVTNETCYGTADGSIKVINPNASNWQIFLYDNMFNLHMTAPVAAADTTLPGLSADAYIVVSRIGNITVDSVEVRVESPAPVVPSFEISEYYPNVGDIVSFNNVSVGSISYSWTFGDGDGDTLEHTSHAYSSPGAYEIVLTATNEFGCVETAFDSVWVSAPSFAGPQNGNGNPNFRNEQNQPSNASARGSEINIIGGSQRVVVRTSSEGQVTINLLNLNGQLLSTTQSADQMTELAVSRGVYLVQVVSAKGEAKTQTVVVND